jgi:hypothetical protein
MDLNVNCRPVYLNLERALLQMCYIIRNVIYEILTSKNV